MHSSVRIIYASTSGHTEYVVEVLARCLEEQNAGLDVTVRRAELCDAADLTAADVLVLASGTWNMHGQEGQLNDRMQDLLFKRATETDLRNTPVAIISLGDQRYYYTARATEHFMRFLKEHNGKMLLPPLTIVNEPYGQEERVEKWGVALMKRLA